MAERDPLQDLRFTLFSGEVVRLREMAPGMWRAFRLIGLGPSTWTELLGGEFLQGEQFLARAELLRLGGNDA